MSTTTAAKLYAREPESTTHELWQLQDGNNTVMPEIDAFYWHFKSNERVTLKVLKDFCFDGRRTWSLFTVWLDGNPVMIVQRAGREGDDHIKRFITDSARYDEMVAYLNSLLPVNENDPQPFINLHEEREDLDSFYNHELNGKFEGR